MASEQNIGRGLRELALFAGAGGGILGGKLLGWECVCGVEIDPYAASVLIARQNEGILAPFPIWDDVRSFNGKPWRGLIDVVSGGFPCTDISIAGAGAGLEGDESKLWGEQARIIGEVRPRFAFVENSPALTFRGGLRVVGDIAELGYDCLWGVMGADDAIWSYGPPCVDHERKRIWIMACRSSDAIGDGDGDGLQAGELSSGRQAELASIGKSDFPTADSHGLRELQSQGSIENKRRRIVHSDKETSGANSDRRIEMESSDNGAAHGEKTVGETTEPTGGWWSTEPDVDRVVHGLPNRVDRLKAIGMAQVPAVVKLAWETLAS